MPKRSVHDYKPLKALPAVGARFYSREDIDSIIGKAGGLRNGEVEVEGINNDGEVITLKLPCLAGLILRLERLASSYRISLELKKSATAKQKAAAFKEIESAAWPMLRALSLPKNRPKGNLLDHVPTALTFSVFPDFGMNLLHYSTPRGGTRREGVRRLRTAIEAIYLLQEWAGHARLVAEQYPPTKRSERSQGNPSLDNWIKGLGRVWKDVFNRKIGASVSSDSGKAGGPFIRFLHACLEPVLVGAHRATRLFAIASGACSRKNRAN